MVSIQFLSYLQYYWEWVSIELFLACGKFFPLQERGWGDKQALFIFIWSPMDGFATGVYGLLIYHTENENDNQTFFVGVFCIVP